MTIRYNMCGSRNSFLEFLEFIRGIFKKKSLGYVLLENNHLLDGNSDATTHTIVIRGLATESTVAGLCARVK